MYKKEKELVTEEFVQRKDTYNLMSGGHGGGTPNSNVRIKLAKRQIGRKWIYSPDQDRSAAIKASDDIPKGWIKGRKEKK